MRIANPFRLLVLLAGCVAVALELLAGSPGAEVQATGLLTVAGVIAV